MNPIQAFRVFLDRVNPFGALKRKVEMNLIERLIAGFIERSCKHYVTTIIGVISVVLYALSQFGTIIPAQYQSAVSLGSILLSGVALLLAKDSGLPLPTFPAPIAPQPPDLSKFGAVLLAALLLPAMAHSQSAVNATIPPVPQTTPSFTSAAGPLAVEYNGQWSAASVERETLDIADFGATKANHVLVNGIQLEMPVPGVNLYMGGVALVPDLSALFKRTNLPAGSLGAFFDGNVGVGTPATGASEISWMAGGGVTYRLASALTWQPLTVQYGRFGSQGFVAMSTQLEFAFKR